VGREPDAQLLRFLERERQNAGRAEIHKKWSDRISFHHLLMALGIDVHQSTGISITFEEFEAINLHAESVLGSSLSHMTFIQYQFFAAEILPNYRTVLKKERYYDKYEVNSVGLILNLPPGNQH
jgi:hypothetical protein